MSSFGCLARGTVELISDIMSKCMFHVDPNPASWLGSRVIQVEVCQVVKTVSNTVIHGWLIDPCLPCDVFSLEKRKSTSASVHPSRVRQCQVLIDFQTPLEISPGNIIAGQMNLAVVNQVRQARPIRFHDLWLIVPACNLEKANKFVHLFAGAFHGWGPAVKYLEEKWFFQNRSIDQH